MLVEGKKQVLPVLPPSLINIAREDGLTRLLSFPYTNFPLHLGGGPCYRPEKMLVIYSCQELRILKYEQTTLESTCTAPAIAQAVCQT